MYPWVDYAGKFSPLRAVVFAALFLPGLYVTIAFSLGMLGSRPVTEAIHQLGLWTIRLIFLALVISPARRLLTWPRLIEIRRMIGVAAFCYIVAHFAIYCGDEAFDFGAVASEIVLRIYLTIGFVALTGLAVLTATSTDGMMRRLGGRRWQNLHKIVYLIGILAIIHFFMQSKADVWEPLWMAGIYVWLMGWRVLDRLAPRGRPVPLWQVAGLTVLATAATGLGEAVYFNLALNAPLLRVIEANFSTETGIRPSWVVLGVTGLMTLAAIVRRLTGRCAASPGRNRASAARGA